MTTDLADISHVEITMNGFTLPLAECWVEGYSVSPILDPSGRTVIATEQTFRFGAYITPTNCPGFEMLADGSIPDNTDAVMTFLRKTMCQTGGEFFVRGIGIGEIHVNNPDGTGVRDIDYGPRYKLLSLTEIGSDLCWKVAIEAVIRTLGQCDVPVYKGIKSWTYKSSWSVGFDGRQKYTRNVSLEIAGNRSSPTATAITDNADAYLSTIIPDVPFNFRRETTNRNLDESKTKLTVTITDTELPGFAPPRGVVKCEMHHDATAKGPNYNQWRGTLSASYTVTPGVDRLVTWEHFYSAAKERLGYTARRALVERAGKPPRSAVIPFELNIRSGNLYGADGGSFSIAYTYILSQKLMSSAINLAGIWFPPPGGRDYTGWLQSMLDGDVFAPNGVAQLKFTNDQDKLLNLCDTRSPPPSLGTPGPFSAMRAARSTAPRRPAGSPTRMMSTSGEPLAPTVGGIALGSSGSASGDGLAIIPPESGDRDEANDGPPDLGDFLNLEAPVPSRSWISWQCDIAIVEKPNVAIFNRLPLSPVSYTPQTTDQNAVTGQISGWSTDAPPPIVQVRGAPRIYAYLVGRAVRVGYPISPPIVSQIGGVACFPVDNGNTPTFRTGVRGNLGIPVIEATWCQKYVLLGVPRLGVIAPENPMLGMAAEDDNLEGYEIDEG